MTTCACGCGDPAPVATRTDRSRGYVKGRRRQFIHGHNTRLRPEMERRPRREALRAREGRLSSQLWTARICEECSGTEKLNWAYKGPNGGFERRREAYRVLCPRCHGAFDREKEAVDA